MRNEDKERLNQQTQKKYLLLRLATGCKAVWENTVHKIILVAFYPTAILVWYLFKSNLGLEDIPLVSPVLFVLVDLMLPALLIVGTLVILILFGTPYGFNKTSNEFQRIGMTNVPPMSSAGSIRSTRTIKTGEIRGISSRPRLFLNKYQMSMAAG